MRCGKVWVRCGNKTVLFSYLDFLLQYTRRLSNRKKTLSWMFPAEIFSRLPWRRSSVQISVRFVPWFKKKKKKRISEKHSDKFILLTHTDPPELSARYHIKISPTARHNLQPELIQAIPLIIKLQESYTEELSGRKNNKIRKNKDFKIHETFFQTCSLSSKIGVWLI